MRAQIFYISIQNNRFHGSMCDRGQSYWVSSSTPLSHPLLPPLVPNEAQRFKSKFCIGKAEPMEEEQEWFPDF